MTDPEMEEWIANWRRQAEDPQQGQSAYAATMKTFVVEGEPAVKLMDLVRMLFEATEKYERDVGKGEALNILRSLTISLFFNAYEAQQEIDRRARSN